MTEKLNIMLSYLKVWCKSLNTALKHQVTLSTEFACLYANHSTITWPDGGTCGEHGILLHWYSSQALQGRGSLLCWRSDAERPSMSMQDWAKKHKREFHRTHPPFSLCSTASETTEEAHQLWMILWKETHREKSTDSGQVFCRKRLEDFEHIFHMQSWQCLCKGLLINHCNEMLTYI